MKPVVEVFKMAEGGRMVMFECPGCGYTHGLPVDSGKPPRWTFNDDVEKPTLSPSILMRSTVPITDEQADAIMRGETVDPVPVVCHSFVRDGQIQFLSDSTHKLAGQTIPLPPIEEKP